jgi:hypothetical protein
MRKITLTCEEKGSKVHLELEDNIYSTYRILELLDKFVKASGYEIDGNLIRMWASVEEKPTYSWQQNSMNITSSTPTITQLTTVDLSALTAKSLPAITSNQIQSFTQIPISSLGESNYGQWKDYKPAPTMAPLTAESIRALTSADLAAWKL